MKELAERSPAKKYVNLLLLVMARNDVHEVVLRSTRALPPLKIDPDAKIPPFKSVVNRLKVMANLDPVTYQQPQEGRIELTIGSDRLAVHVRFVDAGPERSVHLLLEWLESPKLRLAPRIT